MKLLSETQTLFINQGALNRKRLRMTAQRAITNNRHTYIFSPPGLGKTYTIEDEFKKQNTNWVDIKGNTSLWGFIVDIAQIVSNKDDDDLIVFIDDCDTLLTQTDSINTMKIALKDGVLEYKKPLGPQYAMLQEDQKIAIDQFRKEGRTGVSIPLDGVRFIWASNYKLADQQDSANAKSERQQQRCIHEEALRRRMHTLDYDVEGDIKWGWIADCVLNETPPSMQAAERIELEQIVSWMHSNWDSLKEHNISFAEKLHEEMKMDSDGYLTIWELDYLI
jgi:hypothetical protein